MPGFDGVPKTFPGHSSDREIEDWPADDQTHFHSPASGRSGRDGASGVRPMCSSKIRWTSMIA